MSTTDTTTAADLRAARAGLHTAREAMQATRAAHDLLERAEHALLDLASTWDTRRAWRLARLIQRYSDRAFAVGRRLDAPNDAFVALRRVIDLSPSAARNARSVARSNGVDVTADADHWSYPIR
ncbi:hypothetical protein CFK39_15920 (plasmid) [Brachybacterium avium]|uniref:Uncharacterized protein n=1 Tax=Brachybacterium avium TaxID=2017485 RepID=A0A220UGH0_9MICO|nr:hypothetical protein [Brachybacterium avium]ASK67334.1 hypothetical protein CFK39_15920 [Brachybacterium avium]